MKNILIPKPCFPASITALLFLYAGSVHSETLSDCYATVEATDQYLEESSLDEKMRKNIETMLGNAVKDCESGQVARGMAILGKVSKKLDGSSSGHASISKWKTDFGELELQQRGKRITGSYPKYKGQIKATLNHQHTVHGYWVQPSSDVKCKKPRDGSYHWGTFTFNAINSKHFKGSWAYCDRKEGSGGKWNGHFKSGTRPDLKTRTTKASTLTKDMAIGMVLDEYRLSYKHGNPVHLKTDITCDGVDDYVFGWEETVNPDASGYHITVVHNTSGKPELSDTLLRISGETGGADHLPELCKVSEHFKPELTAAAADKDISRHHKLPSSCKRSIAIDDGACDKIYLMWNPAGKNGDKEIFYRLN